ncbi:5'-3' exonuclease [Aestuariimicrobium kwangyangense]|uniref:5'-3' exonuclease n=1 Tax=Aestuariimicrobium kwangyangense TaxID=396389 RepID=UPI00047A9CB7|nr:5'-3' exonuclease [Aestuariimicrobium kwangyangense]
MVFDTASLYFRSFFGVPNSVTSPDGTPVNAVRGLMDSLARLIEQYHPGAIACAWDNDWRPTWRVDLVPSYKAHRVAQVVGDAAHEVVGAGGTGAVSGQAEEAADELAVQVPIIREVLAAYGIPVIGVDDHEADDVLGSLAHQATRPVLVVTGDRDLFQLATGEVKVIYVGKGVAKHDLVDSAWVEAKYGVNADQYVDFSVLRGDASDGLPGVAGIGEKSAAQLIQAYGGLDEIAVAATDPDSGMSNGLRTKLAGAVEYLGPAQVVVQVVTDLDLPSVDDLESLPWDGERVAALSERWGLGSSAERLNAALGH